MELVNASASITSPIAVFDSGVGGLTVMRSVVDALPHEDIIYLGDTARVPYGNRGADTIRRYVFNAVSLLTQYNIKALVVACNTATAYALPALRAHYKDLPIIGVVEPVARQASQTTRTGHIGVLGTRATVRSQSYPQTLAAMEPRHKVYQLACPLFVPMAEEGWVQDEIAYQIARRYLSPLSSTDIDTLILGCTHYPLLRETLLQVTAEIIPGPVSILDSAHATAQTLKRILREQSMLQPASKQPRYRFFLTDTPDEFIDIASIFFGQSIAHYEHVDIQDKSKPAK